MSLRPQNRPYWCENCQNNLFPLCVLELVSEKRAKRGVRGVFSFRGWCHDSWCHAVVWLIALPLIGPWPLWPCESMTDFIFIFHKYLLAGCRWKWLALYCMCLSLCSKAAVYVEHCVSMSYCPNYPSVSRRL